MREFYKYEITNDSITLTFEELKFKGGDCKNYADLYTILGKELGYLSRTKAFTISKERRIGHAFSVLSSEEGYCVLDQTRLVGCMFLNLGDAN